MLGRERNNFCDFSETFLLIFCKSLDPSYCRWKLSVMIYPWTTTLSLGLFLLDVVCKLFTVFCTRVYLIVYLVLKILVCTLGRSAHTALLLFSNWMHTALEIKFLLQMFLLTSSESAVCNLSFLAVWKVSVLKTCLPVFWLRVPLNMTGHKEDLNEFIKKKKKRK